MKKFVMAALAVAFVVSMVGCSSFDTATINNNDIKLSTDSKYTAVAHVHGKIWGVYLFGVIPFFSGSSTKPGHFVAFDDSVTVNRAVYMTMKSTQSCLNSTTVVDMNTVEESSWILPTLLFWYKSIQVSGNALR